MKISKPINLTGHYSEIKSIELKHKSDDKNSKLLQQFLPALTTWDSVIKSINKTNANA